MRQKLALIGPYALGFLFGIAAFTRFDRDWLYADLILFAVAAAIATREKRLPPAWLLILAGGTAVTFLWSADRLASSMWAARIVALGIVGAHLVRRQDLRPFVIGALWGLGNHALLLAPGLLEGRQAGLTRYATILGAVGYMMAVLVPAGGSRWVRWPGWAIAGVTLAASGARAPMVGIWTGQLIARPRIAVVLGAVIVTAMFLYVAGGRVGAEALLAGLGGRVDTITAEGDVCSPARAVYGEDYQCAPGKLSWFGSGAGAYMAANPWPRPHNIYSIAIHELGLLAMVPAGVLTWALWTRRLAIAPVAGLLVMGILDDTPLSQPEGHWITAVAMVMAATAARTSVERGAALPAAVGSQRRLLSKLFGYPGPAPAISQSPPEQQTEQPDRDPLDHEVSVERHR